LKEEEEEKRRKEKKNRLEGVPLPVLVPDSVVRRAFPLQKIFINGGNYSLL